MMSGDGLAVRVRPRLARLTADQALGLCQAAATFGIGAIDLTNRANLQIRGVSEADHPALLSTLEALGLLDPDADTETKHNILVTPFWSPGDLSDRVARALIDAVPRLPNLPAKFGFAVDCGPSRHLAKASADIRVELDRSGQTIVRADGGSLGLAATEDTVISAIVEMAQWFVNVSNGTKRMRRLPTDLPRPQAWTPLDPTEDAQPLRPRDGPTGQIVGVPFGQIQAQELADLIVAHRPEALRVTPWRMMILEGVSGLISDVFVTEPGDPLLTADACPGAPYCPSASVETRSLARYLAPSAKGTLHVSGCVKGCARSRAADIALVGRDGRFDLVRAGCAWDEPSIVGLGPDDLPEHVS